MISRLALMGMILTSHAVGSISISDEEMLILKCKSCTDSTFYMSHNDIDREADQDMYEERMAYLKVHFMGHDWHAVKLVHHSDCKCGLR